jgi:hypothetical protein
MHKKLKFASVFGFFTIMLPMGVGAQSVKLRGKAVRIGLATDLSGMFRLHPYS